MQALIMASPGAVIERCPAELVAAASYPDTITVAARMIATGRRTGI